MKLWASWFLTLAGCAAVGAAFYAALGNDAPDKVGAMVGALRSPSTSSAHGTQAAAPDRSASYTGGPGGRLPAKR